MIANFYFSNLCADKRVYFLNFTENPDYRLSNPNATAFRNDTEDSDTRKEVGNPTKNKLGKKKMQTEMITRFSHPW